MSTTVHPATGTFAIITVVFSCTLCLSVQSVHAQESEITDQLEVNLQLDTVGTEVETLVSYTGLYPVERLGESSTIIGDFVVGPGKVEVTLKPGQTKIVELLVTNRTGSDRIFNLTTEDASGSKDPNTAVVLLGSDRGPYSLREYLEVPHTRFQIKNNERARVPVTISVPADAEPGGYYGSMLVDTIAVTGESDDSGETAPQSAIVARIGTLFFITVPGDVEREGALVDFGTIPKQSFFQGGPIQFGVLFENTGSIHLTPYAEVRIKNMFDEEVGYLTLDPWFVLPQALRLREFSWNRDMLFGRYTATVSLNRGYNDLIDEMSLTFWVLPWKPVVGAFGLLFIVFFTIRAFFKKFEFRRK
jgi:hypothetical protein